MEFGVSTSLLIHKFTISPIDQFTIKLISKNKDQQTQRQVQQQYFQ